jgi:hypothetical protein
MLLWVALTYTHMDLEVVLPYVPFQSFCGGNYEEPTWRKEEPDQCVPLCDDGFFATQFASAIH